MISVLSAVAEIEGEKDLYREERRKLLPVMHQMPVKENYSKALAEFLKL